MMLGWLRRRESSGSISVDHGGAAGRDIINSPVTVHGIPFERYEQLRNDLGVTDEALATFFAIIEREKVPRWELEKTLKEIAGRYKELLARLEATSAADPRVKALKEQTAAALKAGDFDAAERLLSEAKALDLAAIERMQADLDARKLSAADTASQEGYIAATNLRYREAADYFAEAVRLTPESHTDLLSDRLTAWTEAAWRAGDYQTALNAARRALALDEARLPADDARLGMRLNNLAMMLKISGRHAEAEPLYERAIAIGETTLGSEHPALATRLNNLAELYRAAGRWPEAELLYERAIAIGEKTLGPEHPDLATWLNNLANLHQDTGRLAEAEPLYGRALAIREKTRGSDHPDVAQSLNNLALLYQDTGRLAEAEPLMKRAVAIDEKALGSEHPDLAIGLNNLALLYRETGRHAEAAPLYARAGDYREGARAGAPSGGHPAQQPRQSLRRYRPARRGRAAL